MDAAGNLYGLTGDGGVGQGTAYELSPKNKQYVATALYDFCHVGNCEDGLLPLGRLTLDAKGNLFGATENGGLPGSDGILFKLVPKGENSRQTVLYDFCSEDNCTDGADPNGDLAMDADGDLFGSAFTEGANHNGAIFKFSNGKEQVLYPFCSVGDRCSDGSAPAGSVITDAAGNIFGTTSAGGTGVPASGTVFELTP